MGRERLEIEFGRYSEWMVDAIEALGMAGAVGVACRGTANPHLFERVARSLELARGASVLDVGCGLGGPGKWLQDQFGYRVVGVDVMERSVKGLHRLWPELPAVVASTRRLPFGPACFDGAWALGVLETIADKKGALQDVYRVLMPGSRFAIYSFVASDDYLEDAPVADRFESADAVIGQMRATDFLIDEAVPVPPIEKQPRDWRDDVERVRVEVEKRHGDEPSFELVRTELSKIASLFKDGRIEPWQFVLRKES